MKTIIEKNKKQDLGIFYTDPLIVNFIYDILNLWKEKEDKKEKRWDSRNPTPHYPSVIDPACGEGIFLKTALEKGFTLPKYVWGADLDEHVIERWESINLLKSFGSKAELSNHFFHQNGLLPLDESKVFSHKKGGLKEFDAVVGNPPYGGIGVNLNKKIDKQFLTTLEEYEILKCRKVDNSNVLKIDNGQMNLFEQSINGDSTHLNTLEINELAENTPIEVLFIERFIKLAKPNGWIALIIPEGIFSNSILNYVRKFILENAIPELIISLPRSAFKNTGTYAKTSILFMRRLKDFNPLNNEKRNIFIASLEDISDKALDLILQNYKEYNMSKNLLKNERVFLDEKNGIFVRVDKTLKEMMEEKPSSRWDVDYWHPKYDEMFDKIKYKVEYLDKYLESTVSGRDWSKKKSKSGKIRFYRTINIQDTGIEFWKRPDTITKDGFNDSQALRLKEGDILLTRNSFRNTQTLLGRAVLIEKAEYEAVPSGDIRIIRLQKDKNAESSLYPGFLVVLLKSKFGQLQIFRFGSGVDSMKINEEHIKHIKIPVIDKNVQKSIHDEYLKILKVHNKGINYKEEENEKRYEETISEAKDQLDKLITKVENYLEGKQGL